MSDEDEKLTAIVLQRLANDSGHRVRAEDVEANPDGPFYCAWCNQPIVTATRGRCDFAPRTAV